jgi:tripartite-type tricarboxylate transporter receptor subunit TctC
MRLRCLISHRKRTFLPVPWEEKISKHIEAPMKFNELIKSVVILGLVFGTINAQAQQYPQRPVTIIVPFTPGGPIDAVARVLAQKLTVGLGQPFIVDNRPGATGAIGTAAVAKSKPDGYTLLIASSSSQIIAPSLRNHPAFRPIDDFTPVGMLARYPYCLVVNSDLPIKSVAELVASAKSAPDKLNYASLGEGSGNHILAEQFKKKAGVSMQHVPYKGISPAATALMTGEVQVAFDNPGSVRTMRERGKVRPLAVTGTTRSALLPNVPTLQEAGYEGFEHFVWFGLFAPHDVPASIVAQINLEVAKLVVSEEYKNVLTTIGAENYSVNIKTLPAELAREMVVWKKLVTTLQIPVE